jgi:hypothetical protein
MLFFGVSGQFPALQSSVLNPVRRGGETTRQLPIVSDGKLLPDVRERPNQLALDRARHAG